MKRPYLFRDRNPLTYAAHQHDVRVQILFPLMLALIGGLLLLAFTIGATTAARSMWADVSLILLSVITMFAALVSLALFVGLAYGVWYLGRRLPPYFRMAQEVVARVASTVHLIATRATRVFILVQGLQAGAQRVIHWRQAGQAGPRRDNARNRASSLVH